MLLGLQHLLLQLPPLRRREQGALFTVGQEVGQLGLQVVQDLLSLRGRLTSNLGDMELRLSQTEIKILKSRREPFSHTDRVQGPGGDVPDVFEEIIPRHDALHVHVQLVPQGHDLLVQLLRPGRKDTGTHL